MFFQQPLFWTKHLNSDKQIDSTNTMYPLTINLEILQSITGKWIANTTSTHTIQGKI